MSAFATKIDVCLSMAGSHTVKNIADIFQSVKLGNISGYFFDAPLFFVLFVIRRVAVPSGNGSAGKFFCPATNKKRLGIRFFFHWHEPGSALA